MRIHFRAETNYIRILELTPDLRRQIEATVEHLIGILDQFDGDADFEDGGDDEPSLGWTMMQARFSAYNLPAGMIGVEPDRELEDEHDEDDGTSEPSLGAPERHPASFESLHAGVLLPLDPVEPRHVRERSQEHWADGLRGDHEREEDHDGEHCWRDMEKA